MIYALIAFIYLATIGGLLFVGHKYVTGQNERFARIEDERRDQDIRERAERERLMVERNSLLERIQRPEHIPPVPFAGPPPVDDTIHDELHLVGAVTGPPTDPEAA